MPDPVADAFYDRCLEELAMRRTGLLGRGGDMGNALYAIDYDSLPPEARKTIGLIVSNGPFPYPARDGTAFGNTAHDLPRGRYLEYTVPTPGLGTRGARRIVARLVTAQLFFTACHYERVHVKGGSPEQRVALRRKATAELDEQWRNGFYVITGMPPALRQGVSAAIKARS